MRLIWQLWPSYLIIVVVSLLVATLYLSAFLERFFLDKTKRDLLVRGQLLENQAVRFLSPLDAVKINHLCREAGEASGTRITVILPDGTVIGDSEKNPGIMDNHKNRPEILAAIDGRTGSSTRESETLRMRMMYVALPLLTGERVIAVLRISLPVTSIYSTIKSLQSRVMVVGLLIAVLAAIISLFVSRRISRPIEEMKQGAVRFSQGDLGHRLHVPSISELASLSEAMNQMAYQLEEHIRAVQNQRNEYVAVLSSMTEGVIGLDLDENVLNINQAARDLFDTDVSDLKGRSIQEVVRNPDFIAFIKESAATGDTMEGDFILHQRGDRTISARSAPLRNAADERIGTLLVLSDVTQMRNLENMRRDFVANVSHEIRTPLTAIKGFVETLGFENDNTAEDNRRFLGIIAKHVDRLDTILEDLLSLARIEARGEGDGIDLETRDLQEVIQTARQVVQGKADEKKIALETEVEDGIRVKMDAPLIEQALVNLIDNALKYSPEETVIRIRAEVGPEVLIISIADQGPGIPEKHLYRIFERFYRVDKARSRKLGGTGLGLAIVKHIAASHGGRVSVESTLGQGSTFTLHLPRHDRMTA